MNSLLSIDIETYSTLDLKKVGLYKYAENCEILLIAFAFNEDPVTILDISGGDMLPEIFRNALQLECVTKTAWNATFERVVLSRCLGLTLHAEQWDCTQLRAAYKGLSLGLGETAQILGTEVQKLKTNLVTWFCKPDTKGVARERDGEKWDLFKEYNKVDVDTERAIRKRLLDVNVERDLWALDGYINDRGVLIDQTLITNAIKFDAQRISEANDEIKSISDIVNPNSAIQLRKYLQDNGILTDSVDKENVIRLLDGELPPMVRRVLELRQTASKTSSKKYLALERSMCSDGRVRGLTQMCGATRTGRWAGRVVQVQNLYRNREPLLDEARQLVKAGHNPYLIFDEDILSQLVRTAFVSTTGLLTIADFSAIEARVLAWLADEKWVMDVFAGDGKIYEAQAARMFGVELEAVTKELRAKGKVATLALGYQGALGALHKMGAEGDDETLGGLVTAWRKANPNIVKLWNYVEDAAFDVIANGGRRMVKCLTFSRDDLWFYITLPSGRRLCYVKPEIRELKIHYEGVYESRWAKQETYGGKLVENIVQGIARDCLADTLLRCKHLPIIMHVHDEIVLEGNHLDEMLELMSRPISRAPGLILKGDGFTHEYYRK